METADVFLRPIQDAFPQLNEKKSQVFYSYYQLLCQWNERSGLVSPNSLITAARTHFLDSIYISEFSEKFREKMSVVDVGSGGGFPGLVYGVCFPDVSIKVYERISKKRAFLSFVVTQLGISNVHVEGEFKSTLEKPSLLLARAVWPPREALRFFTEKFPSRSRFALALADGANAPESIEVQGVDEYSYELGESLGVRRVQVFERL